jgi:hypothetical protein
VKPLNATTSGLQDQFLFATRFPSIPTAVHGRILKLLIKDESCPRSYKNALRVFKLEDDRHSRGCMVNGEFMKIVDTGLLPSQELGEATAVYKGTITNNLGYETGVDQDAIDYGFAR